MMKSNAAFAARAFIIEPHFTITEIPPVDRCTAASSRDVPPQRRPAFLIFRGILPAIRYARQAKLSSRARLITAQSTESNPGFESSQSSSVGQYTATVLYITSHTDDRRLEVSVNSFVISNLGVASTASSNSAVYGPELVLRTYTNLPHRYLGAAHAIWGSSLLEVQRLEVVSCSAGQQGREKNGGCQADAS